MAEGVSMIMRVKKRHETKLLRGASFRNARSDHVRQGKLAPYITKMAEKIIMNGLLSSEHEAAARSV
jgi:hypothetical protein